MDVPSQVHSTFHQVIASPGAEVSPQNRAAAAFCTALSPSPAFPEEQEEVSWQRCQAPADATAVCAGEIPAEAGDGLTQPNIRIPSQD